MLSFVKMNGVKKFLYILAAVLTAVSCEHINYSLPGTPRGGRTTPGGGNKERKDSSSAENSAKPDTLVWVSGISVPEGYDWLRDTAMGASNARLVLYCNDEQVLDEPIGPQYSLNPYPDSHHLIGGRLYSEYVSGGETTILCDAKPLFKYEGHEYLKGLVAKNDSLFTLGCNYAEGCYVMRQNGNPIIKLSGGKVPGGLGENAPALYEDGGHIYFCFIDGKGLDLVEDGVVKTINLPSFAKEALDCRMIEGVRYLVSSDGNNIYCSFNGKTINLHYMGKVKNDFFAMRLLGDAAVIGSVNNLTFDGFTQITMMERNRNLFLKGQDLYICECGEKIIGIRNRPLNMQYGRASSIGDFESIFSAPDAFVFTKECINAGHGNIYAAASSVKGDKPCLFKNGRKWREFPFNGYLTGVNVELSLPGSGDGFGRKGR